MPLQSGNDKILGLMRRRYRRDVFYDRVMKIRELITDASIGPDVIVGFPGETEEDFKETHNFLESLPLSYLHVFAFSPRPGTPAEIMPGAVKKTEKEHRSRQLIRLSGRKHTQFMQSLSGKVYDVLFEKRSTDGMLSGLTGNYVRILVPYRKDLPNTIKQVRLTTIRDYASMNGELIENSGT
jgi:threonylcarbamoyladenosine tRNA methylthiotransferase MtaB